MSDNRIRECPDPERWRARVARMSVESAEGCLIWEGVADRYGYGKFKFRLVRNGRVRQTGAHRAAWLAERGAIEGDLVIDHLCRNTLCVNVSHMELVSNQVNTLRGDHSGKKGRSGKRREAELHSCGQHGRTDGSLALYRDGYTRWVCRACARRRGAEMRARRAAAT